MRESESVHARSLSIYEGGSRGAVVVGRGGSPVTEATTHSPQQQQQAQPQSEWIDLNSLSREATVVTTEGTSEGLLRSNGTKYERMNNDRERRRPSSYESSSRGTTSREGGGRRRSYQPNSESNDHSSRGKNRRLPHRDNNVSHHTDSKYSRGGRNNMRQGLGAPSWSLIVKNLPPNMTTTLLQEAMERFGVSVKDIYIPLNFYTRESRDFAFVEYYDEGSMLQALRDTMDMELEGSRLVIEEARSSRKTTDYFTSSYRGDRRDGVESRSDRGGRDYYRDSSGGGSSSHTRRERSAGGGRSTGHGSSSSRVNNHSKSWGDARSGRERWRSSSRENY